MVLVSFVLVVVAAIALVIGLLQSGLGIIYVSIACSVLAGIVLVVAVMRGRPEARPAAAPTARPAPQAAPPPPSAAEADADRTVVSAPPPPPPPPPAEREREPAMAGAGRGAATGVGAAGVSDRTEQLDQAEIEQAVTDADADADAADAYAADADAADDAVGGFPIHDYEKLRATEILPMLAELDEDQLEAVRRREEAGKHRFMILSRIDDELQAREGEGWDADDEGWRPGEEEPTGEPAEPAPVSVAPPAGRRAAAGEFPIPDYDDLRALEVLGRLSDLDSAELEAVRRREESGARRAMIINRIDRLQEEAGPDDDALAPESLVEPEAAPVPSRTARSRKAPAARGAKAAKRAPAAKKAAPGQARKATKKGVKEPLPAAKAGSRAAPAGKAPSAKKAAKKAPAAKAPAGRAAKSPAAKASGARAAKKSGVPVKKATKRR